MRSGRAVVVALLGAAATVLGARHADADGEGCGRGRRPWILVEFGARSLSALRVPEVTTQLRAGLAARGVDVCATAPSGGPSPIATLVISRVEGKESDLVLEVRDAVTEKWVERDLDLHSTPLDEQALAIAVDADELLRATWAELALKDAPATRAVVPPEVRDIVAASIAVAPAEASASSRWTMGLRGSVERFTGGLTFLGGDVRNEYWFAPRWSLGVAVGYRLTPSVSSSLGEVSASGLHGALGGAFALTPRSRRAGLDLALSLDTYVIHFDPRATAGASAIPSSDAALTATLMAGGWVAFGGHLRLRWAAGAALPIRIVRAFADGQSVESTAGLGILGAMDVVVSF